MICSFNRMSRRIKQLAKGFLGARSKATSTRDEETLFQGSTSSTSRRRILLSHVDPELQGRTVALQRNEVTKHFICTLSIKINRIIEWVLYYFVG